MSKINIVDLARVQRAREIEDERRRLEENRLEDEKRAAAWERDMPRLIPDGIWYRMEPDEFGDSLKFVMGVAGAGPMNPWLRVEPWWDFAEQRWWLIVRSTLDAYDPTSLYLKSADDPAWTEGVVWEAIYEYCMVAGVLDDVEEMAVA